MTTKIPASLPATVPGAYKFIMKTCHIDVTTTLLKPLQKSEWFQLSWFLAASQTLMETNYHCSFSNRHSSHGDLTNQNIGEPWQQKYHPLVLLVK